MDATTILEEVAREVAKCEKCGLHFSRKLAVPGDGPADAQIMFIGEGPGFYENEQGKPFVGPAGHFLDELLAQAGLKREKVFIGNVVKCRPPGNRDPQPDELAACKPYLERQITAIDPIVIVTLGRFSMSHFIANGKISAIHGQPVWVGDRLIVPMYHPAAALHQPALRGSIMTDFAGLPRFLDLAKSKKSDNSNGATELHVKKVDIGDMAVLEKDNDSNLAGDGEDAPQQLPLF
ncbi:MAG: uracil-DNA glycosylase [Anaerolineaceae bacterium]|nr:uracil-DNA glycosylase [Anaerolineaceae bacterium]MBN2676970.1 uracil-DNA glycosylase [Anaerolineaceae bacterium]